jgi:hypothetical protein
VLSELGNADIEIDQTYFDLPYSGFGAEAGHYGLAALATGYAQESNERFCRITGTQPPTYGVPSQLKSLVRRLILEPSFRDEANESAINFFQIPVLVNLSLTGSCGHQTPKLQNHPHEQ